ncbi:hypothetical protein AMTR_s00054p00218090 [Amborella trichopoda]|uniref:Uncharacterized protein n=1 Tax=Amborella trichopoda TaxID=13333 RepID=U5CXY4_AMBTC|nr:hypothetical protein AMTR_s00054p00218090 [Amborella trichopoda]
MSTSYASDYKELLGIPFEKIRGRHDSEINLGKLRWEFTGVPYRAERMIGGRAPCVSIFVGGRQSHRGKAPVEEDGAGVSESVEGESSHPLHEGAARSSGDVEGVGRDTLDLGDGSTFFYEDTVPPQVLLADEELREQERERICDAYEWAMIEDEIEVFRQETSYEVTPPWTLIMVSTTDEGAYLRELAPWIEEWRSKAARVIGKEEEEGISLPQYEDRYRVVLRDIATLTNHGEGVMRGLRTAYLDEGRSYTGEVTSLHAERDSAIEERDSIAQDFEHLH